MKQEQGYLSHQIAEYLTQLQDAGEAAERFEARIRSLLELVNELTGMSALKDPQSGYEITTYDKLCLYKSGLTPRKVVREIFSGRLAPEEFADMLLRALKALADSIHALSLIASAVEDALNDQRVKAAKVAKKLCGPQP